MILSLFLFSLNIQAKVYVPTSKHGLYQNHQVYIAIRAALKPYGDFAAKEKLDAPEDKILPTKKELSPSEKMMEEIKAKNRAAIAKRDAEVFAKEKLSGPDAWKKQVEETRKGWINEIEATRAGWQKEQDIFLGRIKIYKENTFKIPDLVEPKITEKKMVVQDMPEVVIVAGSFDVPIRDQEARPTCAAFAGIRALEILLAQNNESHDLSEQYLYWASKPECQSSPCNVKGSWVTPGFNYSKMQSRPDIPTENNCIYARSTSPKNETQVPLSGSCKDGVAKVEAFEMVKTLAQVLEKIKANTPVVVAATLTENFYKNQGLITLEDSHKNLGVGMDGHALGHAFLAVGFMELPEKLQKTEGQYCLIVANSWGLGWGAGGHACITESWMLKYRLNTSFIAPTQVSTL